jgi:hypothetical protein
MTTRQSRGAPAASGSGKGVDFQGGPVIDPTKNVLDLVDAEAKYQNSMRESEAKYQDGMRRAESRRIDDMAGLRVMYEAQISQVLTVQVKTTSELISTQLDKVTTALGLQITSSVNSLLERIGQLERFRWEVGGKTSVQDPAMLSAITAMTQAIAALQAKGEEGHGRAIERGERRLDNSSNLALAVAGFVAMGLVLTGLNYFAIHH